MKTARCPNSKNRNKPKYHLDCHRVVTHNSRRFQYDACWRVGRVRRYVAICQTVRGRSGGSATSPPFAMRSTLTPATALHPAAAPAATFVSVSLAQSQPDAEDSQEEAGLQQYCPTPSAAMGLGAKGGDWTVTLTRRGKTDGSQGQVSCKSLRDNNLSGSMLAGLARPDHPEIMSSDRNSLTRGIPPEFSRPSKLSILTLASPLTGRNTPPPAMTGEGETALLLARATRVSCGPRVSGGCRRQV